MFNVISRIYVVSQVYVDMVKASEVSYMYLTKMSELCLVCIHICILIGVCTEFSLLNCLLFLASWITGNFLVKNSIPDNILNFNCDKA